MRTNEFSRKTVLPILTLASILGMGALGHAAATEVPFPERPPTEWPHPTPPPGDDGGLPDTTPEKDLKAKLEAHFALDFDFGKEITNLTPHDDKKSEPHLVELDYHPSRPTLVWKDYAGGFRVKKYYNYEGGIGAHVRFYYDNVSGVLDDVWAVAGVTPVVGKDVETIQYVPTLEAARNPPKINKPPMEAEDLLKWEVGDSVTVQSHGGVAFFFGFGYMGIGPATVGLAKGTWGIYVQKYSDYHAYVKINHLELRSFSVQMGAYLSTIGITNFKNYDEGFSFLLDLSTDVGQKVFHDLVRGNVAAAQSMAAPHTAVEYIEAYKTREHGKTKYRFIGIPMLLERTWTKGFIYGITNTDNYLGDEIYETHYGVFEREKISRTFFFRHKNRREVFYGAKYMQKRNETGQVKTGYFGEYEFESGVDHSDHYKLRKSVAELVRKTGLRKYLTLNIPTKEKLEFTNIHFSMFLTEQHTDRLIAAVTGPNPIAVESLARRNLDTYFAAGDVNELCADFGWDYDHCMVAMKKDTKKGAQAMVANLRQMARTKNSDPAAFSAAYARFGEGMAKNQFTFQTVLKLLGAGVDLQYDVEGTHTSSYNIKMVTTADPSVMIVERAPVRGTRLLNQLSPTSSRQPSMASGNL